MSGDSASNTLSNNRELENQISETQKKLNLSLDLRDKHRSDLMNIHQELSNGIDTDFDTNKILI